jgi:hypothetical protein
MITLTNNPKLARLEYKSQEQPTQKTFQVVYLYCSSIGVRIYYHHTAIYTRPVPRGSWDPEPRKIRVALTRALKVQIEAAVMQELWARAVVGASDEDASTQEDVVAVWPVELDSDMAPEEVEL